MGRPAKIVAETAISMDANTVEDILECEATEKVVHGPYKGSVE